MRRIYRRRPCGGGGGSGGGNRDVTAPYRALLGSSLVALWDARVGVQLIGGEVNGWADQIGGVVLMASDSATRPTYAPDGTHLRARNVIGIANASNKRLGNIATPPVLGVGANPALFMVGRLTSVVAGNRWFVRVYDAPLSNAQFGLLMQFGTNMTCEFAGESFSPAFADAASAHVFEQLYGSVHTVAIDGATIATGASGALLSPTGRIGVGGNGSGTAGTVQDMSVAMVGIINPAPSAATRSQLLALINSDWGTPVPAPPSAQILGPLLHADFDAADPNIVLNGSNVASIPNRGTDTAAMVQATATAQPAFSATSFAGGPGMTFDGVDDTMACTFTTPIPVGRRPYMWTVFKANTATGDQIVSILEAAGAARYLVTWCNKATSAGFSAGMLPGAAGTVNALLGAPDVNTHLMEVGDTIGGIAGFVFDGVATSPAAAAFVPLDQAMPVLRLGSVLGTAQLANCVIRRVIVASDLPSQAQIDAMRAYLRSQSYGLP